MLREGFPDSVTSDYLEYSLWRGIRGIAAQVSGVIATQVSLVDWVSLIDSLDLIL